MEKKEIGIDSPVAVAGVTLIPIAQVWLNCQHGNGGFSFWGTKQPIGIVAILPSAKKAFRITGEEVSLDQFLQEVPSLKEMLEKF